MITYYQRGTIWKGSDCEFEVVIIPACGTYVDFEEVESITIDFFTTEGGVSIHKENFEVEGKFARVHFYSAELDGLDDGVIKYRVSYEQVDATTTFATNSNFTLKTPAQYTAQTFVTEENVEEIVNEKMESSTALTEIVETAVEGVMEGYATTAQTQELEYAIDCKQDALTPGEGISISGTVISCIYSGGTGPQGATGAQGEKGDKGDKGDTGAQGEKGDNGDKGDTGAQGEKGDKGDTGAQGAQGEKGDKGDTGAQGEKGDKGDIGAQGPQGAKGDKGDKGDTGAQGPQGERGPQGPAGSGGSIEGAVTSTTITTIWTGTQSAYDAISTKSNTTLYFIRT